MFFCFTYDIGAQNAASCDVIAMSGIGGDSCGPSVFWFTAPEPTKPPHD